MAFPLLPIALAGGVVVALVLSRRKEGLVARPQAPETPAGAPTPPAGSPGRVVLRPSTQDVLARPAAITSRYPWQAVTASPCPLGMRWVPHGSPESAAVEPYPGEPWVYAPYQPPVGPLQPSYKGRCVPR